MIDHWVLDYLGRPWEPGKDGPCAYDCWGLVRAVFRERHGIFLPVIPADTDSIRSIKNAVSEGMMMVSWERIEKHEDGAVLLMSHGRIPHHIGIAVEIGEKPMVLHSVEGCGVILQDMMSLKLHGWHVREICRVVI
ncbi:MAG: C40 family peptidase [Magnetococcales bacterium]|nr:C40 family peptidase [Magnetococcales bacterium]